MKYVSNLSLFILVFVISFNNNPLYGESLELHNSPKKAIVNQLLKRADSLMTIGSFIQVNKELKGFLATNKAEANQWGALLTPIYTKLVGSYGNLGQIDSISSILKQQFKWVKLYGGTAVDLGKLYHNYGQISLFHKEYSNAIKSYKIALLFKKQNKPIDLSNLISTYRELAFAYDNSADYVNANKNYTTALELVKLLKEPNAYLEFSIIEKYSSFLYNQQEYEILKNLLHYALKLDYSSKYQKIESTLYCYQKLIDDLYLPTNDFIQARHYLNLSMDTLNKYPDFKANFETSNRLLDAIIDYQEMNYSNSLKKFESILNLKDQEETKSFTSYSRANIIYMMFESALALKNFDLAKKYHEIYFKELSMDLQKNSLFIAESQLDKLKIYEIENAKSPLNSALVSKVKNIFSSINFDETKPISINDMLKKRNLEMIVQKAYSTLVINFNIEKEPTKAQTLLNLIFRRLELKSLQQSLGLSNTIGAMQYKAEHELIAVGLEIIASLDATSHSEALVEKALMLMERDKNNQLYISIKKSDLNNTSELPKSVFQEEQNLHLQVQQYILSQNNTADTSKTKTKFLEIQISYASFIDKMVSQYPDKFLEKYNIEFFNKTKFFKSREKQKCSYLEYFISDSDIYSIIIDGDNKIHFYQKSLGDNNELLQNLNVLQGILNQHPSEHNEADIEIFQKVSAKLRQILWDPIEKFASANIIIAPDNLLQNLPFDILIYDENNSKTKWSDLKYLLNKWTISYTPSLQFLSINRQITKHSQKAFLGMAYTPPANNKYQAAILEFAEAEVQNISKIVKGDNLVQQDCNFKNLKEKAPNYKILHLACHAKSDSSNGNESFLLLSDFRAKQPAIVYAHDLLGLHLNQELVVLSACESALGQKSIGEGIIGLTRGFFYTGAHCVLSTLWQVSDFQASEILQDFYKNLNNNQSKAEALENAKRNYVKTASGIRSHPFYWASFILSGNEIPLQAKNPFITFLLVSSIALLLGLLWWFKFRNFNKAK